MRLWYVYFAVFVFISSLVLASGISLDSLDVTLARSSYAGGEFLNGTIVAHASQPLDPTQMVKATLADAVFRRELSDILDAEKILYFLKDAAYQSKNPSTSKTFVFPSAGSARFYVKLPADAVVDSVDLGLQGKSSSQSYPRFVTMDVGADGREEWAYFGQLDGFAQEILPSGLREDMPGGVALLTNREDYYCELISVPKSRDFAVRVKYRTLANGGDLAAVMFSLTSTTKASGGADMCDLEEASGSGMDYRECTISLDVFVSGERLFCVYNSLFSSNPSAGDLYEVQQDSDSGSGRVCGPIVSGSSTCSASPQDFFIKVAPANYSGELRGGVQFEEWLTEYDLADAFNQELEDCDGECLIPVVVTSDSRGILYADALKVRYRIGTSGTFVESTFYDASPTGGEIISVAGKNLTGNGTSFTFDVDTLGVFAPIVSTPGKNYTLEVCVEGTTTCDKVGVTLTAAPSEKIVDVHTALETYDDILNKVLTSHGDLLAALDTKLAVENGLRQIISFRLEEQNINKSTNLTESQKQDQYDALFDRVGAAMSELPRSIVVKKTATDTIVVGIDDLLEGVLLPTQRDQESTNKVYSYQQGFTVTGTASHYELEYFNGDMDSGTLIKKSVSGAGSNVYLVEVIPSSAASTLDALSFSGTPEVVQSTSPIIARWMYPSLGLQTISYVLEGDKIAQLSALKTILVPQTLPAFSQRVTSPVSYTCGDDVCSVFETADGTLIELETPLTCPQDCKRAFSWTPFVIGLLLILAIIYYLNFYRGKHGLKDFFLSMKQKKFLPHFKGREHFGKQVFIAQADQRNITSYVQTSFAKGFSKSQIIKALLAKGWRSEQIDAVFKALKK